MGSRVGAKLTFRRLIFVLLVGALFIGIPNSTIINTQTVPLNRVKDHVCISSNGRGVIVNVRRPNRTLPTSKLILGREAARAAFLAQIKKLPVKSRTKRAELKKRISLLNAEIAEIRSCARGEFYRPSDPISTCGNGVLDADEKCDYSVSAYSQCCSQSCTPQPLGTSCSIGSESPSQCEVFACNGAGACSVQNREGTCDDNQQCTTNDRCVGRSCVGAPIDPAQDQVTSCGEGECKRSVLACSLNPVCTPGIPTEETCNGLDDDCDGEIDENLGTISCGTGVCTNQVSACVNGTPQTCAPLGGIAEVCNGKDDDCDGLVDEGLGIILCGTGVCQRSAEACIQGKAGRCIPGQPLTEMCNAIDDDCDGDVDEGIGTITCGIGACTKTSAACVSGFLSWCGQAGTLNPAQPEICNGIDDNCDGSVDNLPQRTCGIGACNRSAPACYDGKATTCEPGTPSAEICNGIDDDCNGTVDNEALCPSRPNAIAGCYQSQCSYTCAFGFADGNGNISDGCEVNLSNDVANCGTLGNVCSTSKTCQQPVCIGGQCSAAPAAEGTACGFVAKGQYGCDGEYIYGPATYVCDKYEACVGGAKMPCSQFECSMYFGCLNRCSPWIPNSCGPGFVCKPTLIAGLNACVLAT